MAYFDASKNAVHDTTASLFGESCSWTPLLGGPAQVAQVNYNHPDEPDPLGDLVTAEWEFTALDTWIEYRAPQFPGLKASVDTKARELVTLTDHTGTVIGTFRVMKVVRVFDGDTFKARLGPV